MTIDYTETVSTQSPTEGSEVSYLKSKFYLGFIYGLIRK